MDSRTFQIPSMVEEDVPVIQNDLQEINGVRDVQIYLPTQNITVTWTSPATWDQIVRHLAELNFTPDFPNRDF